MSARRSEKYVAYFLTGEPKLQFLLIFKTPVVPLRGLTQFFLSYYHMNQVYFPTSFAALTTESAPSIQHLIDSGVTQFVLLNKVKRGGEGGMWLDLLFSSSEGWELGKSENERPAAEACQHSYITSSQHLAVIMGGSRSASLALTGWLHLHFWLTTAPHHVAGPPPSRPRSPRQEHTRTERSCSACVLLLCLHLLHDCSVSLLGYVKMPSLFFFFRMA